MDNELAGPAAVRVARHLRHAPPVDADGRQGVPGPHSADEPLLEHRVPRHASRPGHAADADGGRHVDHDVRFRGSPVRPSAHGRVETIPLEPRPVADFYALVLETLDRLGLDVRVWAMPVKSPIPSGSTWTRAPCRTTRLPRPTSGGFCSRSSRCSTIFRAGFVGKCSPVHFFWGSFDLAVTRFSGRRAPERPGADAVTREAYSHEVISHGFWPGGGAVQEPAFYAYAAPEPAGFKSGRRARARRTTATSWASSSFRTKRCARRPHLRRT